MLPRASLESSAGLSVVACLGYFALTKLLRSVRPWIRDVMRWRRFFNEAGLSGSALEQQGCSEKLSVCPGHQAHAVFCVLARSSYESSQAHQPKEVVRYPGHFRFSELKLKMSGRVITPAWCISGKSGCCHVSIRPSRLNRNEGVVGWPSGLLAMF